MLALDNNGIAKEHKQEGTDKEFPHLVRVKKQSSILQETPVRLVASSIFKWPFVYLLTPPWYTVEQGVRLTPRLCFCSMQAPTDSLKRRGLVDSLSDRVFWWAMIFAEFCRGPLDLPMRYCSPLMDKRAVIHFSLEVRLRAHSSNTLFSCFNGLTGNTSHTFGRKELHQQFTEPRTAARYRRQRRVPT